MANSQIHINESPKVTCQRYLNHVFAEYYQPTAPAFPPGSASNPVVVLDDDQPGSALNPLVIPDEEPLNPRLEPQPPEPTSLQNLVDSLQDQSSALELEESHYLAPESCSSSSRPSSNSDSSVTSCLASIIPPDSILDQTSTTEAASTPETSSIPGASSTTGALSIPQASSISEASSTPDRSSSGETTTTAHPLSASHAFPIADVSPPSSPISDISLTLHSALRWPTQPGSASPPRRDDSCQPTAADLWNDTICSKCKQRGHVASAHCSTCGLPGHSASNHCRMCHQIGHNDRDHCILCSHFGHCVVGYCARAHCKRCGVTGHDDSHHCTRCSVLGHRHYHHCDVCDTFKCKTEDHCYVCAELGHSSKDHCEVCEEFGHTGNDHCWGCKQLGHCWNECQEQNRGIFCRICRSHGHGSDTCLSRKQNELREKWAFKRLQRSRSNQVYCQCCLEIRQPGYSFHQEHKLKDCPKLSHKIACLKKDHRSQKCQEWIMRPHQSTATQVNLAEFPTDVDLSSLDETEDEHDDSRVSIPPSVFTAISCSTQTAFSGVRFGRESHHPLRSNYPTLGKSLPVEETAKTSKDCEAGTQYGEAECGADSGASVCKEASDRLAPPRCSPETLDEDQREESEEFELPRLEKDAQCRLDMQKITDEIMLEEDGTPDAETASLNTQEPSEGHLPIDQLDICDVQTVLENLVESLSILEKSLEEDLSEEANMPAVQVSSSDPQPFTSMEPEQADIQQRNDSSSAGQENEEENLFNENEIAAARASSHVSLDGDHNESARKSTSIVPNISMSSEAVLTTSVQSMSANCSTVGCLNPPSSDDVKRNSCSDARSLGKHKRQLCLMGKTSVRKRKSKPRKALANKKQKPDSNLESLCPASDRGTVEAQAGINRNNDGVSLGENLQISWKELIHMVMLEAPGHSSNFKQLCNLARNWLHNTFPSLDFDIDDKDMTDNLQAVVKNKPNFESSKSDRASKKNKNPVEVSIRPNAIKKVEIVVSCLKTRLARPEFHTNMVPHRLPKSGVRPEISFENLIGMALHAANRKYLKEIKIVMWITKSIPGYKGEGRWIPRLREELHASSFFAKRVSDAGDEEWTFRKGCSKYFGKWEDRYSQA